MDGSVNGHLKTPKVINEWVWYHGTDALKEGEAVCYNTTFGTAADGDASRGNRVARPGADNNMAFAGVAARNYSAQAGGQFIEIYVPGSTGVKVALGADVTINTGILTFTVGAGGAGGRFVKPGYRGRGSVVPRQTVTALIEANMAGEWSLATDGVTLTVTSTDGLAPGDTVVLLAGADTGSSKAILPGKYTVKSITDATVLVLTGLAVGALPSAALKCTGYAYNGNPTCIADLLTGDESGGVEFLAPPNTGAATSMSYMVGGVTYICGGITVGTANANGALADGAFLGLQKGFYCLGTITTKEVSVTLATAGEQVNVVTATGVPEAIASVLFNAANEFIHLVWYGIWKERAHSGATIAAS